jgi:hypothetical protein
MNSGPMPHTVSSLGEADEICILWRLVPDRASLIRGSWVYVNPSLCYILSYARMDARKNETTPQTWTE